MDPQSNMRDPWTKAWAHSNRESNWNADVDKVARVKGRNTRIWSAVERLHRLYSGDTHWIANKILPGGMGNSLPKQPGIEHSGLGGRKGHVHGLIKDEGEMGLLV